MQNLVANRRPVQPTPKPRRRRGPARHSRYSRLLTFVNGAVATLERFAGRARISVVPAKAPRPVEIYRRRCG